MYARRSAEYVSGATRGTIPPAHGLACRLNFVNRRIPNGTYGGVGGRGLDAPSYPISCFQHELFNRMNTTNEEPIIP